MLAPNIHSRPPTRKYKPITTTAAFTANNMMSGKNFTITKIIAISPINSNIFALFFFLLYSYYSTIIEACQPLIEECYS